MSGYHHSTMQTLGFSLFETAIGHCGIAWSNAGLTGVQLPGPDAAASRARMRHRFPGVSECHAPGEMQQAMRDVQSLLRGEHNDLRHIVLDMDGVGDFHQRVYALARAIDPGQTRTYGELAQALGEPGAARAVGQALGHNPYAPVVPCHRILAADGRSGGFSANGGVATKLRMLLIEQAQFGAPGLFDSATNNHSG